MPIEAAVQQDVAVIRDLRGFLVLRGDREKIARLTDPPSGWVLWSAVFIAGVQLFTAGSEFGRSQWLLATVSGLLAVATPLSIFGGVSYKAIRALEDREGRSKRRASRAEAACLNPSFTLDIRWLQLAPLLLGLAALCLVILIGRR